jgi:hypothetical protein
MQIVKPLMLLALFGCTRGNQLRTLVLYTRRVASTGTKSTSRKGLSSVHDMYISPNPIHSWGSCLTPLLTPNCLSNGMFGFQDTNRLWTLMGLFRQVNTRID